MEELELKNFFRDLLSLSTMTLATSNFAGGSFAAPLFFVAVPPLSGENQLHTRLYFFSEEKSQHAKNVSLNPEAAVAIYPQGSGWQDIHGFQMRGRVFQVNSQTEWEYAWDQYQEKFPFVKNMKPLISVHRLYVFVPNWVRLIDNRRKFGYKKEWRLE